MCPFHGHNPDSAPHMSMTSLTILLSSRHILELYDVVPNGFSEYGRQNLEMEGAIL